MVLGLRVRAPGSFLTFLELFLSMHDDDNDDKNGIIFKHLSVPYINVIFRTMPRQVFFEMF